MAVLQVDGAGLPDTPEIGANLVLRARIRLGELSVSDVTVQAVIGKAGPDEELTDIVTVPMTHFASEESGELFVADLALPLSGSVGYTVRVPPHHRLLVAPSELGLVTAPNP